MRRGVDVCETPPSLLYVVAVNLEYAILMCTKPQCMRAQAVKGIVEHLRSFHREKPAIRKEAGEFGCSLVRRDACFVHDYKGVEMPVDGLPPQPIVPVIEGFGCRLFRFLTISRCVVRKHANREHYRLCQCTLSAKKGP